jgi:hypothetical protein
MRDLLELLVRGALALIGLGLLAWAVRWVSTILPL